jgi:2-C-methyl-D-erythritol 2,4-cyclodiphosphate synthase
VSVRAGIGFDVHPLEEGRALVLGGVVVPSPRGLAGHSDGDALCHAIIDALLGASNLGDIGAHFPVDDPSLDGASSLEMLERIGDVLRSHGYDVVNVDATVALEHPRLAPHRDGMRARIAAALRIDASAVSVKATTADRLGAIGRGEGAAALAIAVVEPRASRG